MLWEADLLGILPSLGTKKGSPTAAHKVLSQLVKLGLLVRYTGQRRLTDEVPSLHHLVIPKKARLVEGYLQAPETVHWADTYKCHSRFLPVKPLMVS